MIRLTKQEQLVLTVVLLLLLTGWAVRAYRTAHPAATGRTSRIEIKCKPSAFEEVVEKIVALDPRYHRDAYHFVREALDYTQKAIHKDDPSNATRRDRHVSGQQLLDGIRDFALAQFGPMVLTVFEEWGVRRGEDFGEIVSNLVENGNGLFGRSERDSADDFKGGYDFEEAFKKPFLPSQEAAKVVAESKPAQK